MEHGKSIKVRKDKLLFNKQIKIRQVNALKIIIVFFSIRLINILSIENTNSIVFHSKMVLITHEYILYI